MKSLVIALLCGAFFVSNAHGELIADYNETTYYHFFGSAAIGVGVHGIMNQASPVREDEKTARRIVSTALCVAPGLVKELTDMNFDVIDFAADVGGCVFGVMVADKLWVHPIPHGVAVGGRW